MLDLVVEGNAYLDGSINKCCIGIEDGKIVAIKKILKGEQHFDFGEKLILPAGIDIHVHFRDPGFCEKEDFRTGTMAAAFGGIGCIFDMPNTNPLVISKKTVLEKLEIVSKKAYVDFGLYSSITPKSNIPKIAEVCSGFKLYLGTSTGKLLFPSDGTLASALYLINNSSRLPVIHAESEKILKNHKKPGEIAKNLHDHLRQRPNEAEVNAISNILSIARSWEREARKVQSTNQMQVHICHVSSAEAVELLREHERKQQHRSTDQESRTNQSKNGNQNNQINQVDHINERNQTIQKIQTNQPGQRNQHGTTIVTAEVTPHHLLLNENCDVAAFGKVNPPLRRPEDQAALWSALADGTIQILASDHAPHSIDEKSSEFNSAPAGIPGVETMLPMMLSHHKHYRLSLERLVSAISTVPATNFRLPKGRLAIGYDGDLVVIDFYKEEIIKAKNLHSKCGWTPYEKMDSIFPKLTVVRGNIIIKDGNLETGPGNGKFYN